MERPALVSPSEARICVDRQCELAGANRDSVYRLDKVGKQLSHGENEANLALIKQLVKLHGMVRDGHWTLPARSDFSRV